MHQLKQHHIFFLSAVIIFFSSCHKEFKKDDHSAYFGGEVTNPSNPYVLFCNDTAVIDSVKLDKNNRFLIKFDSLETGLYTFKNDPEYLASYYQLGKMLEEKNKASEAIDVYKAGKSVAKKQNDMKTLGEIAEALMLLDVYEE